MAILDLTQYGLLDPNVLNLALVAKPAVQPNEPDSQTTEGVTDDPERS